MNGLNASVDVLIDTNVVIWLDQQPDKIGQRAKTVLDDPSSSVFVSAASAWEIATKVRKGKLRLSTTPTEFVVTYRAHELSIAFADAELAGALDWEYSDPFDRMILAQAQRRSLTLITADRLMLSYAPVAIIPAR